MINNKDGIWAQCPMDDMFFMCKPNRLSYLPYQIRADVIADLVFVLDEVVIQTNGIRCVLENNGWTQLMGGKIHSAQYARVFKGL